jgi:hypothetical protein
MAIIRNTTSSRFKFTPPFCHVLPLHNIFAVNRNKMAMNFSRSFSCRVKKSNYCTNLSCGGILYRHGHFKHILWTERCRDCGRWTLPWPTVPISHGSTAISEKLSLAFLLDLHPDSSDISHTNDALNFHRDTRVNATLVARLLLSQIAQKLSRWKKGVCTSRICSHSRILLASKMFVTVREALSNAQPEYDNRLIVNETPRHKKYLR